MNDPLADLTAAGVSVWLDTLSRDLIAGGELASMIADRQVVGVTTNPTVFASAVAEGRRYTEQLNVLGDSGRGSGDAITAIVTADVRDCCRLLRPVFDDTAGMDGRVSIEVDPRLAADSETMADQARVLCLMVDEPNLFVKIPATSTGLAAIATVISEGISVNANLIFSVERYRQVADAYLRGLERARNAGEDLSLIRLVASFFVSRVDVEVDTRLDAVGTPGALDLKGRSALANGRLAYQAHEEVLNGDRWRALAAARARPPRLLWTSTGVKQPSCPDTMYVDGLVAAGTVHSMSREMLAAFADHGAVTGDTVHGMRPEAHFEALRLHGVDFRDVIDTLERDGIVRITRNWDDLATIVSHEPDTRHPLER